MTRPHRPGYRLTNRGWLNAAQTIADMREEKIEGESPDREDKPPVSEDEKRRQWEAVRSVS